MFCECNTIREDYSIELVQGDYASYIYEITDLEGNALTNVKDIVFTCSTLKLQQTLTEIANGYYALILPSEITQAFTAGTRKYDITIQFNDDATPYTIIRNASFTILKKENPLNG